MKFIYTVLLVFIGLISAFAQVQPTTRFVNKEYRPLTDGIFLTEELNFETYWDDVCYEVNLDLPVNLNVFGLTFNTMEVCSDGRIIFYTFDKSASYVLMPFHAEYIDKRIDETLLDKSDILYQTSNGFTTVEFRNVSSRVEFGWFGTVTSSFNFQAKIDHFTGNVEYSYGEAAYTEALWDLVIQTNEIAAAGLNIQTGSSNLAWIITGNRNSLGIFYQPNFNGSNFPVNRLKEPPVRNSNAEFVWEVRSSVHSLNMEIEGKIYPNPSTGVMTLDFKDDIFFLEVLDLYGRSHQKLDRLGSLETLQLADIPAGNYIVKVATANGYGTFKWQKL